MKARDARITAKTGKIREVFSDLGEFFKKNILKKKLYMNFFVYLSFIIG
jgi:hypothetical protein